MPYATWKGAVSFGLVNIPVKAFGAVAEHRVSLKMLCPDDKTPLQYKRICPTCKKEIPWNSILRGYEVTKGKYVPLTNDDLESIEVETGRALEIFTFVDLERLDPVYFDSAYFLVPDEASVKPYTLLKQAMETNGKIAIGKVTMHEKQHLVALRPYEEAIVMETLHYADEVKDSKEFPELRKKEKISSEELELASQLIKMMKKPFDFEEFQDTYHESLRQLVEAKLKGKEGLVQAKAPEIKVTKNLMEALKASLKANAKR